MKTIHKLVLKAYLGPMVLTFFIVMFVLMMNIVWRYIDELVGKGLSAGIIIELMTYFMANMIPMGLPLSMLLAAIMTMGNLGENYELLAMKSAGMSLVKITKPLIILVSIVSVGSFFIGNDLVPSANKKLYSTLYDIRQQKQALEFQDGLFFNGIDNMSIRVSHQDPDTHLLHNVLIYDNREANNNMNTILADSGYIRLSDDKRFLLVTLFHGETYEQTRNSQWFTKSALRHHIFDLQKQVIRMEGFAMERTDADLFNNSSTKDISDLSHDIDSLEVKVNAATTTSYEPLLKEQIFVRDNSVLPQPDSLRVDKSGYRDLRCPAADAREGQGVEPRADAGQKFAQHLLVVRRIDGQGGAQPALPLEGRMAQEALPAGVDPHFLPDRRPVGSHHPPRRSGTSRGGLGHLLRDLLHHQPHGREAGQGRQLGGRLRRLALDLHSDADRRLPHMEGHERFGAARHRLVRRTDQGPAGSDRPGGGPADRQIEIQNQK